MFYRRFGKTNIKIPIFSTGGMRFQYKWENVPDEEIPADNQINLEETIQRSYEHGMNHFETARDYGTSEKQLGKFLKSFPREKIIVQTKIQPTKDPDEFKQNLKESFDRLQLDYIDLFAIHGINNPETLAFTINKNGCFKVAKEFQKKKKIKHIGFSTHGSLDIIQKTINFNDENGFDYINLHWYYIFQNNWPAILKATKKDMGIFIISPSDKGGKLYSPSQKLKELCNPLHPLVFNHLFCLSKPEVHTLSIGAAKPDEFDLHLEVLDLLKTTTIIPDIEKNLNQTMFDCVGKDYALNFTSGLPKWEDTPDNINIPVILWLSNLAQAYDMIEYAKMRYNLLGQGGHWFPGNTAANLNNIDLEESLKFSPFKKQILAALEETHELLFDEPEKRLSQQ